MYSRISKSFCILAMVILVFTAGTACGGDDSNSSENDENGSNQTNGDNANNENNGEECIDPCTEGATRCSGSGVQTCVDVDGCTIWDEAVACEGEQSCSGGECVEVCSDACELGDSECDGESGVRYCEQQSSGCLDWSTTQECSVGHSCEAGVCAGCFDGVQQCGADEFSLEECSDGEFAPIATCPIGCSEDECMTEIACSAGEQRCMNDVVEMCNESGTAYMHIATCAAACDGGFCVDSCEPGESRCNGDDIEVCNDTGDAWEYEQTCDDTRCEPNFAVCTLDELIIDTDTELDGTIIVDGPVVVHPYTELFSPSGDLTIIATSIDVDYDSSIIMAATGDHPEGRGGDALPSANPTGGTGGSNATAGGNHYLLGYNPDAFARGDDIYVTEGGRGGAGYEGSSLKTSLAGMGGGRLQLIADEITIDGILRADGEDGTAGSHALCEYKSPGGGGAGGGILVATDELRFSGDIYAEGGEGTTGYCPNDDSGDGGEGVVKILVGSSSVDVGAVYGERYDGQVAPLSISSTTHPDSDLYYNDGFDTVAFAWSRPFGSPQGYYYALDTSEEYVPTADDDFVGGEVVTYGREAISAGANYFHIVAVDADSNVGEMEAWFALNINDLGPTVTSSSHADQNMWSTTNDVSLEWSDPRDEENFTGYYYAVDAFGDTVPTEDDDYLPLDEKSVELTDQPDGVWAFHIVTVDTMGHLTTQASTYRFQIGDDPGQGNVLGIVEDESGEAIDDAEVTINRGLLLPDVPDAVSDGDGAYDFNGVPAGEWELRVSAPGYEDAYVNATVDADEDETVNFVLIAE